MHLCVSLHAANSDEGKRLYSTLIIIICTSVYFIFFFLSQSRNPADTSAHTHTHMSEWHEYFAIFLEFYLRHAIDFLVLSMPTKFYDMHNVHTLNYVVSRGSDL